MLQAMTTAHWIGAAVGAACGVLVIYLLLLMARRETPPINQPFETNGEADLMPRSMEVPSHDQLAAAAQMLNGKAESFADVKDTF